ncbi:MAG: hypothetical protein PVH19_13695 [Planctomycetia bacterium]|jgi:hypothetical protein
MHHTHHYHNDRPSPLEIKQLAEFDAALGDMTEEEKKERRVIYLRDAMQQMELGKSILKGFGCFLVFFMIIPIFWPFLIFFWFMKKKMTGMIELQFVNALDYWDIQEYEVTRGE